MFSFNADKVQRYTKESQKQSDEAIQQILEITPEEVEMINSLEEEEAPKDKLYDSFSKNIDLFYSMTGFTVQEFDTLFSIVGDSLTIQGRGRKGSITPPDILILCFIIFVDIQNMKLSDLFFISQNHHLKQFSTNTFHCYAKV